MTRLGEVRRRLLGCEWDRVAAVKRLTRAYILNEMARGSARANIS